MLCKEKRFINSIPNNFIFILSRHQTHQAITTASGDKRGRTISSFRKEQWSSRNTSEKNQKDPNRTPSTHLSLTRAQRATALLSPSPPLLTVGSASCVSPLSSPTPILSRITSPLLFPTYPLPSVAIASPPPKQVPSSPHYACATLTY